nr:zinc finger protein 185-like isoform X38 [Nerophis lumbriciformis]
MANVADKASVLRTTKVRTKLKGDGSWLNRNSDTEETTEEKPWLAEIRARRENGESSPVSSPTSSPLPKPDSDKLPTSGFKIRGVFNKVDTSSTSNGISSDTSHVTKISSDSYKKIAPHTVKPPAEKADSTISSEEQEKRTTAASKALPKTAARERSYVLSAAKKFESQEQAADMSMDNGTTSFVAKRVKVTEEASSNPPPRRSALLSPVAPVPEPKPLNRVSDGVKKTVGHVTFSETTKVEEVHPDREHTFPPPPPPVLAPTKDLLKDRTPDLDDSGDDDTYSLSVHEQVKKFTSKSQPEPEPEPEHFQNSSSRVEALAAMYENLIPSETETSSLKGGEWVMAGKEKDQEDDDSEEDGDGQEPTAGLSNHKATTENLRDLFSGKEKDPLSSHVTTTVTEYSKKKDPLSSHVTSTVTEYSKEKDPLSSYGTTTVTEYSREDPALPAPPSPKPWSKEVTFESKEKDPLSSHVTTTVTEYSREDRALPAPPSPGRLSQDLLTEIESREERTLPVPPSPKKWQQDLLTEIESREDPAPSPGRLSQDWLTELESKEKDPLSSHVTTTVTEYSREEPALPVPPSPGRLSQDLLTELESKEKDPLSSHVTTTVTEYSKKKDPLSSYGTTTVTEYSKEKDPLSSYGTTTVTEYSKEKDPLSSHVTTTVTEYSKEKDPLSSYGTTTVTEYSKEKDPLSSYGTTTVTEYSKEKDPLSSYGTTKVTEYSREEPALPAPRSPKRWSKDRLTELESPTKTHSDVTVTTETVTTSIDSEEKDPLSSRSTTTVTKFSSADAYDPYPIGTTSRNSSSDLLKPISDLSINSSSTSFTEKKDPEIMMSGKATVSFADDITPFDTHATSLSTHRSWARKWETTSPLQTHIEESREDLAEAGEEDQQTLVTFERKSKEDDSPWDKWTSPSVYTLTSTTEEEEEEESLEDSQVHTVTTITTIRDSYGRQEEYGMNRTRLQEVARTPSPDPESKKPFVYLKEYINTTELSSHNASDSNNSWSSSYSSSPSTPCTYCGQLVTNDAKITIEHLNINCHPSCFKCYSCHKPMGDLVYNMFLHGGKVHCESCYSAALD